MNYTDKEFDNKFRSWITLKIIVEIHINSNLIVRWFFTVIWQLILMVIYLPVKFTVNLREITNSNNFLWIYIINHLNITLNYWVRVANYSKHWFYLICFIEMFCINPLKSKELMMSNKFMLTHARYLIYILVHNKL